MCLHNKRSAIAVYWVVLELLAQPGPFDGAWTAATMATRLTWRVTQVQRGLTWAVTSGWAMRVPQPQGAKQLQLYRITPAGVARLRQG
jgi:hypothetical protein